MIKKEQSKDNYIYSYYQAIKDGTVCVGEWIRRIYEIIIHDLEDSECEYEFNNKLANNAIEWIETHCFHSEGKLAPNNLELELWQKALISCIYGLVDKKTGNRHFREVLWVVARKNGKSLLSASIGKYEWLVNGGYGARVYCLAPKLEQADIIYNDIWQMTILDPEWQCLKDEIEDSAQGHNKRTKDDSELARRRMSDLYLPATNSSVKKIAFNARKSDGFNPSLTICDEIASWSGDVGLKQYEVMKSGMGAREEGMLLSCSTAGYVNDSIYDELYKRSTKFLRGDSKERRLLPFLYTIDDITKWNDINELRKSNPNLNVSVSMDYLLEEIAIAEGSLSKKAEFLTKYCNVKQNSSQAWLDTQVVEKACGEPIDLNQFKDCYCVGGIDLSRTTDLTACCCVIEKNGKLNVVAKFFLPSEKIEEATSRDNVPYNIYIQRGLLQLSGTNFIDYKDCFNWFKSLVEDYKLYPLQVGYDRYSSTYLIDEMEQYGFHCDDVYQGNNLTPVINEFGGLLKDGVINIGDNDLLKLHLLSTALKVESETERCRIIKLDQRAHIDGTACLLDAMCVRQKWWNDIGIQLKNEER